jgi:hypothetical protein
VIAVSDGIIAVGVSSGESFGNGDWEGVTSKGDMDATIIKYDPLLMLFVPVSNIINVPVEAVVDIQLTLNGTIMPNNAINQIITWNIVDAGTTGATITGNTFAAVNEGTAKIMATITNGTSINTDYTQQFYIEVNKLDITDILLPQIAIYPNPTNGIFTINNYALGDRNVEIFDITGKKLFTQKIADALNHIIDISHLHSGIYILQIDNEKIKIIKI